MSEQQPECPAEFRWMKPGEIGIQILSQQFVIIQSEPTYMCREWRVTVDYPDSAFGERTRNLSINCEVLENAKSDRTEIVSDLERLRNFRLFDLAKIEAQDKELESLRARLAEAEARASAEAAKVERVKAMLDGVESAMNHASERLLWIKVTDPQREYVEPMLSCLLAVQQELGGAEG